MKKYIILPVTLLAVAFLFSSIAICKKQYQIRSLANFNIEALSSSDAGSSVNIEIQTCTTRGTGWGYDNFAYRDYMAECRPSLNEWIIEGAYPCLGETKQDFGAPIYTCWEIVVR